MRVIRTTVCVAAVLAIGLSACTKKEAAAPQPAAPAMQEQPAAAPDQAAPSGQAGSSEEKPSGDSGSY